MPTTPDLITYAEAAELLQVTRRTIERMIERGELRKFTKPAARGKGRKPVFVDRAQVEQWKKDAATVIEVERKTE